MCTEMASEWAMRSDLLTRRAPASPAFASGRFGTPGDNVHIERNGVAGYARAKTTETDDAERLAGEPYADGHATLEAPDLHRPIGDRDGAGGSDEQAKRQFGRSEGRARAAAGRIADGNALTCASRDVQRGV